MGAEETIAEATEAGGEVFTKAETQEAVNAPVEGSADAPWWEWFTAIDVEGVRAWFEVEVLPHLASVMMILGVALVELIPAVRSLIKARAAFARVASDVDAYNRSKIEYDLRVEAREKEFEARIEALQAAHNETVEALRQTVETYDARLSETEARLTEALSSVAASAWRTERMLYLGMSNSQELIINGAARKISRIEEEAETNE